MIYFLRFEPTVLMIDESLGVLSETHQAKSMHCSCLLSYSTARPCMRKRWLIHWGMNCAWRLTWVRWVCGIICWSAGMSHTYENTRGQMAVEAETYWALYTISYMYDCPYLAQCRGISQTGWWSCKYGFGSDEYTFGFESDRCHHLSVGNETGATICWAFGWSSG